MKKALHGYCPGVAGRTFVLAGILALFLSTGVATAEEYEMEYAVAGTTLEVSQTADYNVVEQVGLMGLVVNVQASGDYSVAPMLDTLAESEAPASVELWMFY